MRKITRADRIRYWFDNTMTRGPLALIAWLFALSALIILVLSLFLRVTHIAPAAEDGSRPGLAELVWMALMRTLDAGTMGGDAGNWPFLFVMLAVTLAGVFVVSTLIGILSSGIEGKLDDLRKGRSLIVEENHTVILGWSEQVIPIITELVAANANQRRSCIAVLAEKDKVEMDDEIRGKAGALGRTRVVCRTGSPLDQADLAIINPESAKAIIILSLESDNPDAHVIKVLLALTNTKRRRPQAYHIVAEIRDQRNVSVALMVGRDEATIVQASNLIPRITAQTCRQSGLSLVYTELLDFGGDEIYMQEEPSLVGKTFGEALLAYEDSAVIGLSSADGQAQVLPPMDTLVRPGDRVIAISADDDTIRPSGRTDHGIDAVLFAAATEPQAPPERTLVLGWNERAHLIIQQLDGYVPSGSHVTVVAEARDGQRLIEDLAVDMRNQTLSFTPADTTDRATLDGLQIESFDHVIVLSYSDELGVQQADARTLITLLHLRDLADKTGRPFSITSEMMDIRNRDLAEVTRADDFVVSNKLVSLMISQVAENRRLGPVFADLFDPEGAEIYLKQASLYVVMGQAVNFYTVVEAARRRGEIAIGYRLQAEEDDVSRAHGIQLNPKKSQSVTFSVKDRVIVLAEG